MIGSARLTQFNQPTDQAIVATGGTISTFNDGTNTYKIHKFTTTGSDSFVVTSGSGNIDVLVVGGGGKGGAVTSDSYSASGGGGAGKVVYQTGIAVTAQTYNIIVGASASSSQAFGITATAGTNAATAYYSVTAGGASANGFAGGAANTTGGGGGGGGASAPGVS